MARPKHNHLAALEMHRCIEKLAAKRNIPNANPREIELWAYANLGVNITRESIRRVLNGTADPAACALEALIAVAGYFDAEPADLGRVAENRLSSVGNFYRPRRGPAQVSRPFPWNDEGDAPEAVVLAFPAEERAS